MTEVEVEKLNKELRGFSDLVQFDLMASADGTKYGLSLTLANADGKRIVLVCGDVQHLELNPAGNGFEQMFRLEVADLRDHGLDRIHFNVEEMENETLFLHCATVELQRPTP